MKNVKSAKGELERSYRANHRELLSWARKFVRRPEDIEDIVQEAYIRSYKQMLEHEIENPRAYLYTATRNLAIKHNNLSANKLSTQLDDLGLEEVLPKEDVVLQGVQAGEEFAHLCEAVSTLPKQCRRAFVLKKIYGLTHAEVAERMDISLSTVHQHVAKGLAKCTTYMKEKGLIKHRTSSSGQGGGSHE